MTRYKKRKGRTGPKPEKKEEPDPFPDIENILSLLFPNSTSAGTGTTPLTTLEIKGVNSVDEKGRTPLHLAAEQDRNSLKHTEDLLRRQANIEVKDKNSRTPVYYAAESENWETCEMLLLRGAQVENDISGENEVRGILETSYRKKYIRNKNYMKMQFEINWPVFKIYNDEYDVIRQNTILHLAIYCKLLDCAEELLKKGAKVDVFNSKKVTPFHLALVHYSGSSQEELMDLLVKNKANINARDCEGKTPLHIAVEKKLKEPLKFLLQNGANINEQDNIGMTPLHYAVQLDSEEIAKELLKPTRGANINITNRRNETPLHCATSFQRILNVKLLLSQGAEIDVLNCDSSTPFLIAAAKGYSEIMCLLADHKAYVNACDENGRTALFMSVMKNDIESVKYLLGKGAEVNIRDAKGKLPVYYAISRAFSDIVELLIQAKTEISETLLEIAVKNNQYNTVKLLVNELKIVQEEKDKSNKDDEKFIKEDSDDNNNNDEKIIDEDIDKNSEDDEENSKDDDENSEDDEENSEDDEENSEDDEETIKNDNKTTKTGPYQDFNVLLTALSYSSDDIVLLLIEEFADVTKELWQGFSPVQCAQTLQRNNLVPYMIDKGADTEEYENEDGQTLLHVTAGKWRMRALTTVMKWMCALTDISIIQDNDGNTPLHIACAKGRNSVVKYLAKHSNRKCFTMKNNKEQTPLDVIRLYKRTSLLKFFEVNS